MRRGKKSAHSIIAVGSNRRNNISKLHVRIFLYFPPSYRVGGQPRTAGVLEPEEVGESKVSGAADHRGVALPQNRREEKEVRGGNGAARIHTQKEKKEEINRRWIVSPLLCHCQQLPPHTPAANRTSPGCAVAIPEFDVEVGGGSDEKKKRRN